MRRRQRLNMGEEVALLSTIDDLLAYTERRGAALPELLPLFVVCEFPCDSLCANAPAAVNAAAARKVAVILRMPMVFPPSWRRRCASRDRVSIAGNKFEKCALAVFRSRFIG